MATARTVKDVSPHEFVKAYAAHLKRSGKMELPDWTDIVKTGALIELVAYDPNWYYIRSASMARKIYFRGGLGVGAFRRIYGGSKRNGSRSPHFGKKAMGLLLLQQLQNMNLRGGLGVGAFRRIYGGSKRNESRSPHFGKKAMGLLLLQQLQNMNLRGGLGVGAFRRIYGGSKRNESRPPHFGKKAMGLLLLQQLQNMNIIDMDPRGGR